MRIAIVEDDPSYVEELAGHVRHFSSENNTQIHITTFRNGMEFVTGYQPCYDLIFLDIDMPLMDGMETARQIRRTDPDVLIIFITQLAQYAIQGYSVSALDYILKPVNYYAFSMKMKHALKLLKGRTDRYIVIPGSESMHRLPLSSVYYIEVHRHTLDYHTSEGVFSYTGSKTISALAEDMAGDGMVRCSQSYLVNLKHVDEVDKNSVRVTGGEVLPVSRNRRKEFLQALLAYWGG